MRQHMARKYCRKMLQENMAKHWQENMVRKVGKNVAKNWQENVATNEKKIYLENWM